MIAFFRMLEQYGLSLRDAEAGGYRDLAQAAQHCLHCPDSVACTRWLKWRGRYGRTPLCSNADYFSRLQGRFKVASRN
ncbi:MAG TPA: DUF6455 family protein [Burkholderiales bacterium]|jgi:hypothetical protein